MDDRELLLALNRRDETALRELRETYGGYCEKIARNILGQNEDAEECVNDAFLRLWNSVPTAAPQNLKLYLARTVRNAALDVYKRQRAQKRGGGEASAVLEELAEALPAPDDGPEEAYLGEELRKSVNAFLHTLSARDCDLFLRRYFYAEDAAQLARSFGLKEANVRLILSRTRKKLKEHLKTEGYIYE